MIVSSRFHKTVTVVAANMSVSILLPCIVLGGLYLACHDPPHFPLASNMTNQIVGILKIFRLAIYLGLLSQGAWPSRLSRVNPPINSVDPLAVRVVVTNYDQGYWALLPTFFPKGASPPDFPLSELRFEIENEYGDVVDRASNIGHLPLFKVPSLCSFMVLPHGCLFGRVMVINEGFLPTPFQWTKAGYIPSELCSVFLLRNLLGVS